MRQSTRLLRINKSVLASQSTRMASTSTATRQITVHPPADTTITRAKGDHWNENGKGFINPWPSAQKMAVSWAIDHERLTS